MKLWNRMEIIVLVAGLAYFIIRHAMTFPNCGVNGDEAQLIFAGFHLPIVFSGFHLPYQFCFWLQTRSTVASMPWGYIEYSYYLHILPIFFKSHFLYRNLEIFLRLPLLWYAGISFLSSYFLIRRISQSGFVALLLSLLFFLCSPLSSTLASELRFHSVFMAYNALSWTFLAYLFTESNAKKAKIYFLLWALTAQLNLWSHAFGFYNYALQVVIAVLYFFRWIPHLESRHFRDFIKSNRWLLSILILLHSYLFFEALEHFINESFKPPPRPWDFHHLKQSLSIVSERISHQIFSSPVELWILLVLALGAYHFFKDRKENKKAWILVTVLAILQVLLTFVIALQVYASDYAPPYWYGRYSMLAIVPFIFFLSFLLSELPLLRGKVTKVGWALCLGILVLNRPTPYWIFIQHTEPNWREVKSKVEQFNLFGQIHAVMGLNPWNDMTATDHSDFLGQVFRIYLNSPYPDHTFKIMPNGACLYGDVKTIAPCTERDKFPLLTRAPKQNDLIVADFCDPHNYVLRLSTKGAGGS